MVRAADDRIHAAAPRAERRIARVFRPLLRTPLALLAVLELLVLAAVPALARWLLGEPYAAATWPASTTCAAAGVIALCAMGLYSRRQRSRLEGVLLRVAAALLAAGAGIALLSYLLPPLALARPVFLLTGPLSFLLLALDRFLFERVVDEDVFRRRVLVYGAGRRAISVTQLRRRSDTRGFRVVGFVATEGDELLVPGERLVEPPGTLLPYCRRHDVDEIVVAMDDRRTAFPIHDLLECRLAGVTVTELVDFLESETGKVRLDVLNPSWIIFSAGFSRTPLRQLTGRLLDIVASAALLALAWPLMLLAMIAVKIEDGWRAPVFYSQVRVGLEGLHFEVLKFRSMRVDAEQVGAPMWATPGDPRMTRVGAVMRKLRIDELPQLLNVLLGDMRFVGPRPERPEFVRELEDRIPYYRERHTAKPGITGWAQLCYAYGASAEDAAEKLQYDLYHVKNHSLLFDLMILLQTVEVVLWGKGAR